MGRSETPSKRVIVYLRVSSHEQGRSGFSLEAQRSQLHHVAAAYWPGAEVQEFSDVQSARGFKRPGWVAVMESIRAGGVLAVLVVDLDRFARNLRDGISVLEELQRRNVVLIAGGQGIDTRTAAGGLVANLLLSVGEFESRAIGERVKRVHQWRRVQGKKGPGLRPWGWTVGEDGNLEVEPVEQRAISFAMAQRAKGVSFSRLAALMNEAGFVPVGGGNWNRGSLHSALANASRRLEEESLKGAPGGSLQ